MLEFRETAVNTLRTSFSEMVDRITERLSEKKRRQHDTIIVDRREVSGHVPIWHMT
jgi:hypothetical protein